MKLFRAYDHRVGTWHALPDCTQSHFRDAICVHKGKIYASYNKHKNFGALEMFDPVAGKWNSIESKLVSSTSMSHNLVSFENQLWMFCRDRESNLYLFRYDSFLQKMDSFPIFEESVKNTISSHMKPLGYKHTKKTFVTDVISYEPKH